MSNTELTLSIIKPDAVERNLQDEIKQEFINKGFDIKKEKKYIFPNRKPSNFTKFTRLNHFIMIYALIYPLDQ